MTDVFLHIPKTAGTSFNTLLTREYRKYGTIVHLPTDEGGDGGKYLVDEYKNELSNLSLVRGHVLFGCHDAFPVDVNYFTILREPSTRIASFLNHMASEAKQYPDDPAPWYEAIRHWTDAVTYHRAHPLQVDNLMVRMISGKAFSPGSCNADILEEALENLYAMPAYGIYEHLYESIFLLRSALDWSVLPLMSRAKKGVRSNIQLTDNDVLFFQELNEFDAKFYAIAEKRFKEQMSRRSAIRTLAKVSSAATPIITSAENTYRRLRQGNYQKVHEE